ncbi:DinB family protein [Chitinophaga japonensis]|uniref:Secreted protein n=1 Tax=Chitinophaga japonensis TaxID=104662 RepID=A0A562SYQ1_CHIJA|nr:DinB family protein [Chitinophaga japonensis]TWI86412.1 secreted protein [Chitinophaga japonensis]
MRTRKTLIDRRNFLKASATLTTAVTGLGLLPLGGWAAPIPGAEAEDNINLIGPKAGYAPQVGTLVSMMNWMRHVVLLSLKGLQQEELDYLHDAKANTIGAMLMHLAATERFYQAHTFEGKQWGDWSEQDKQRWTAASELGESARKTIKGHDLQYYLDALQEVRQHTLDELKKRDDQWLLAVDKKWYWGPTNNYCKWFHVCEHESNHNGQIKWIKGRLPR